MGAAMCLCREKHPDEFNTSYAHYPRQYVARRGTPPEIDGDIFKPCWEAATWSDPFVEIRGDDAPPGTSPSDEQATRVKMLWDDEFLYVAAIMDVAAGDELTAKFTERNSPIFHTDSDFEVFVDPLGSCAGYKELEMNAINTVWNLMLSKPYNDGGGELSGRVAKEGEANYWEVKDQRTAARVLSGKLHDASQPAQWCCEIALAHSDNLSTPVSPWRRPQVGGCWNINFSRVEKKGSVNWVWSPQVVWTPSEGRFQGQVNMHLPDAWGYVVFADADGKLPGDSWLCSSDWEDPAFPVRLAATCTYYAAHTFLSREGRQAKDMDELLGSGLLAGAPVGNCRLEFTPSDKLSRMGGAANPFVIEGQGNGWEVYMQSDRLTEVRPLTVAIAEATKT